MLATTQGGPKEKKKKTVKRTKYIIAFEGWRMNIWKENNKRNETFR
jgi:hypothetical protein